MHNPKEQPTNGLACEVLILHRIDEDILAQEALLANLRKQRDEQAVKVVCLAKEARGQ